MTELLTAAIQQMFAQVPFSKKEEAARTRVERALSERCRELIASGKSEAEATGIVLTQYGDLENALALIGVAPNDLLPDSEDAEEDVPMPLDMLQFVLRCVKTGGRRMGAGAALAVCAPYCFAMRLPAWTFILCLSAACAFIVWGIRTLRGTRTLRFGSCSLSAESHAYAISMQRAARLDCNNRFVLLIALSAVSAVLMLCAGSVSESAKRMLPLYWALLFALPAFGAAQMTGALVRRYRVDKLLTESPTTDIWSDGKHVGLYALIAGVASVIAYAAIRRFCAASESAYLAFPAAALAFGVACTVANIYRYRVDRAQSRRYRIKRIVLLTLCAAFAVGILLMRSGTWYLQQKISTVAAVSHTPLPISYDRETGEYAITDTDGGDFKILQLTDIHIGGSLYTRGKDILALTAVYDLIEHARPDLVIITGDLVYPMGVQSFSLNNYVPFLQFCTYMRNIGIPWAFTYGNHDTELLSTHDAAEINELLAAFSAENGLNLLYSPVQPPVYGRNNQLITVRNADGSVRQALFLLDSNDYASFSFRNYDIIHEDQVRWYADNVERMRAEEGRTVESLLFFHIPIKAYETAAALWEAGSDEVTYYYGGIGESVSCPNEEGPLFPAVLRLASTQGIFVGHDHYNDLSVSYRGVRLTYGKSIDYFVMPGIGKKTAQRGGTLITVHANASLSVAPLLLTDVQGEGTR